MLSIFINDKEKEVNSEGTNFTEDMKLFRLVKFKLLCRYTGNSQSKKILVMMHSQMIFRADNGN